MSLFKRRRSGDDLGPDDAAVEGSAPGDELDDTELDEDGEFEDGAELDDRATGDGAGRGDRTTGPFDVDDAPDIPYLDLGSLRLPSLEGAEVQLQVDESTGQVTSATVVLGESGVQLQAFAAPRSEGIWEEVRTEIAAGVSGQGGTADSLVGPFGTELLGRVPATQPDGKVGFQPLRFVGVDGPRWLLRAVFQGRAAIEPEAAQSLEELVRGTVVVRGGEPMGPRELLPLSLPSHATRVDEAAATGEPAATRDDDLRPFERGPEITEIH